LPTQRAAPPWPIPAARFEEPPCPSNRESADKTQSRLAYRIVVSGSTYPTASRTLESVQRVGSPHLHVVWVSHHHGSLTPHLCLPPLLLRHQRTPWPTNQSFPYPEFYTSGVEIPLPPSGASSTSRGRGWQNHNHHQQALAPLPPSNSGLPSPFPFYPSGFSWGSRRGRLGLGGGRSGPRCSSSGCCKRRCCWASSRWLGVGAVRSRGGGPRQPMRRTVGGVRTSGPEMKEKLKRRKILGLDSGWAFHSGRSSTFSIRESRFILG
jgi:hypothetical protein